MREKVLAVPVSDQRHLKDSLLIFARPAPGRLLAVLFGQQLPRFPQQRRPAGRVMGVRGDQIDQSMGKHVLPKAPQIPRAFFYNGGCIHLE